MFKGLFRIFLEYSFGNVVDLVNRLGFSSIVIFRLIINFLEEGYYVYVDNWYISELFFLYLLEYNRIVSGIIRKIWLKFLVIFIRFL